MAERKDEARMGRRILVVSNETAVGTVLHQAIRFRARNLAGEVLVVAPAPSSRLRRWTSDVDPARRAVEARLARSLERLSAAGISARGRVGDGDPLQAIADALSTFPADEIIIATHPPDRSHWLARDLVGRARSIWDVPILHVVVDLDRGSEYVVEDRRAPLWTTAPTLEAS
jgi:hypothetical protein